uniref:SH3 domain-containing protein n=1 Tax=Anopheles melas TaxID=34690 RepID=A0A182U7Z3_9DIPT
MKSLSLDSPESSELHGQIRRRLPGPTGHGGHGGSGGHLEHSTPPSNNSRLHSPSSPSGTQRKFLYATRGMKTGSVDLPDEIEKSLSSASTSPCPSPVRQNQVTVIDTSDPDWWKGKCLGKVGYFPSKYCAKLAASEKPLQVTHNLQVTDNERGDGTLTLLRDQIVIQVGDEVNGMVMVRSADNRQGVCPVKYLQEDQCHASGHHYHRESRNNFHKSYDRSWEKWEKFREKKMEMMKAHKYNVEHRLKYDNQERILYRHHFNYYPVKRPRPRKTSLEPNWYTENIYSNQSIDNSDGELGVGFGRGGPHGLGGTGGGRDINGNMSMAGLEDDGIFTIDGHFERRHNYPKSNSCCFGVNRMRDIDELDDGQEREGWAERCPKIPKSYSFSTSRSMGVGFNMAKLYNRNSFEMPEFPSHRRRNGEGERAVVRMCDREGCFNETCFSKDEKNFYNNNNLHNNNVNNNSIHSSNNNTYRHNNSNIISEWNLRNRNNLRAGAGEGGDAIAPRPQYVMEEDFDLFDDDDEDGENEEDEDERDRDEHEEIESDLNTLYAEDRHSIACGDYGGVARELYGHPSRIGPGHVADLYRDRHRSKQLLHGRLDRASKFADVEYTDNYRRSFEDFFNQNCCIEHNHRQLQDGGRFLLKTPTTPAKNKSMLEVKPPNRFDDTSSDSTDLELEDFNFDFEKYWEELEKPSPTSPSELEERKTVGRSAMAGAGSAAAPSKKVKNVNLSRCYNNGTVIDIYHDDDPYHRDHYHYREGGIDRDKRLYGELVADAGHHHQEKRPTTAAPHESTSAKTLDPAGNTISGNSNAISFLNNIFSIYKPNKYSPLNCHVEQNYLKNIPAKKMNIVASSAARPLGAGTDRHPAATGSDPSSTKRPLTVHPTKPSVASIATAARRNAARPESTKDPQARFQIIPEKTGVKISPLYRLDAQDYRRARYKLKSTSRPLSFW